MKQRMSSLAAAALVLSACEHPFANAGLQGTPPAPAAQPPVFSADAQDAVLASVTLRALLREHAAAPAAMGIDARVSAGDQADGSPAPESWIEAHSAMVGALAERSRSARRALQAAPAQR